MQTTSRPLAKAGFQLDTIVLGTSIHGAITRERIAARYPQHVRGIVDLNSWPTSAAKTPTQDEFWAADAAPNGAPSTR